MKLCSKLEDERVSEEGSQHYVPARCSATTRRNVFGYFTREGCKGMSAVPTRTSGMPRMERIDVMRDVRGFRT